MSQEDVDKLFGPVKKPIIVTVHSEAVPVPPEDPEEAASRLLGKPRVVHFFTDGPDPAFDDKAYTDYLQTTLGPNFTIENHGDLTSYLLSKDPDSKAKIASGFAEASFAEERMGYSESWPLSKEEKEKLEEKKMDRDPNTPFRDFASSQTLDSPHQGRPRYISHNYYYDLNILGSELGKMLPEQLLGIHDETQHSVLIVTGRGIGNNEGFPNQPRIHMRGGFSSGNIAVVSTTGLVEAPEKPIELLRAWKRSEGLGGGMPNFEDDSKNQKVWDAIRANNNTLSHEVIAKAIEEIFEDQMFHHNDQRITEAAKGLGLSMVLFTQGGYGKAHSCSTTDLAANHPDLSKTCRMHDSHWQEELVNAQIKKPGEPEFCDYHTTLFTKLQEPPRN